MPFGSLVTTSYLSCLRKGHWVVRFDDVDTKRAHQAHANNILNTLQMLGFAIDVVHYQSAYFSAYKVALHCLAKKAFYCSYSRQTLEFCRGPQKGLTLACKMIGKIFTYDRFRRTWQYSIETRCWWCVQSDKSTVHNAPPPLLPNANWM